MALLLSWGLAACTTPSSSPASERTATRDTTMLDWSAFFEAEHATGTMVVLDVATGQVYQHDSDRAARRYTPASTSKVFNGLVFLDQGVINDVDALLAWDGVERSIRSWNRDQSLRTATEVSAVWFFQHHARLVGREGYARVFERQPYGNSTLGEPLHMAWLDGSWRISANEQVAFFDALRRGALPFAPEHQALIRDILPELDSGETWRLKAKTGWGLRDDAPDLGWLTGWVERPEGDVVFAMNAEDDGSGEFDVGPDRLRIVRSILRDWGAFGPPASQSN